MSLDITAVSFYIHLECSLNEKWGNPYLSTMESLPAFEHLFSVDGAVWSGLASVFLGEMLSLEVCFESKDGSISSS